MTRAKRTLSAELEVRLLRSGLCESVHRVYATVCDTRGRVLSSAGSSEKGTFVRSALKPFQALAITSTGTLERYDLTDIDLAIICSSHQGTIEQARRAFNVLWHCHVDPAYLQCPIPKGKRSPLQHGCSGKHAAMLAVSRQRHWPLETYLQPKHPVQQLITNKVAEMLKLPPDELIVARDDCGAPTYYLELSQIATLYALLASGENLDLERIIRAMTHYPKMVAGEGHLDTELMQMSEGKLVSKSGAEGIQCIGRVGEGMGLAIKVIDGAKRAKYAVAIQLLKQMGWITPTQSETLSEKFLTLDEYRRLEVVGELSLI